MESFQTALERLRRHSEINLVPWLICVVGLLSWRLWRFTIVPLLAPTEPRELPYWIPCMFLSASPIEFWILGFGGDGKWGWVLI